MTDIFFDAIVTINNRIMGELIIAQATNDAQRGEKLLAQIELLDEITQEMRKNFEKLKKEDLL